MASNKQPPRYLTSRKMYKDVKHYDHEQFESFCESIYASGYKDGRESVPGVDLTKIMEQIKGVRGIGEKRMAEIEKAVGPLFQNKEASNGDDV